MLNLRLLLVASDPLARAGLATLLTDQPGIHVVGQVGGDTLPDDVDIFQPDIIVWDMGWDPENTLAWLEAFVSDEQVDPSDSPGLIVALVGESETAVHIWSLGIRNLLFRDTTGDRLTAAIAAAALGLSVVEPEWVDDLLPAGSLDEPVLLQELTPRELEVIQLVAEGLTNKAIAQQLGISDHTVKFHVNAIMKKTGAQSRTAAVVRATRLGLVVL